MRTSAALAAVFGDRMDHGDVVIDGRFVDRDRAWVRVGLLRRFVEGTDRHDDPRDVADAARELAEIVAALLAEDRPGEPRSSGRPATAGRAGVPA